jgi:steroid delta-isomerase-like uncharacterized protein
LQDDSKKQLYHKNERIRRFAMNNSQNIDVACRYYKEVWGNGDLAQVGALVADSIVLNGWAPGLDGLKKVITNTRTSFPDLHYTLEEIIEAGDKVVVRFTFHGTHKGEYRSIPPTGKKVSYSGIGIWHLAEGKFVEHWSNVDLYGLLQQLGALPTPG